MNIKNVISVAIFAFLGGCSRQLFSQWFSTTGIIIANLLGCFLLSLLTYSVIERGILSDWLTTGLGTGLIGAFTTFSTFAVTIVKLANHDFSAALIYFLISAVGGLVMALLGFTLAQNLGRRVR